MAIGIPDSESGKERKQMGEIQQRNAGKNPNDLWNYTRLLMLIGQLKADGAISKEEEERLKGSFRELYKVKSNFLIGRSENSSRKIADMEDIKHGRKGDEGGSHRSQA